MAEELSENKTLEKIEPQLKAKFLQKFLMDEIPQQISKELSEEIYPLLVDLEEVCKQTLERKLKNLFESKYMEKRITQAINLMDISNKSTSLNKWRPHDGLRYDPKLIQLIVQKKKLLGQLKTEEEKMQYLYTEVIENRTELNTFTNKLNILDN